ncbi:TPA: lysis protein [Serratia fonticola]
MNKALLVFTAVMLGLLVYLAISNQGLRHDRADLLKTNGQLSGQIDWQNSTQRAVSAIDENRTKELNDAKNQIADLQRAVAAGTRKLQLAATCPDATTSGVVDATGARLTDAAERDYFSLRERIEIARSQIAGLQDYIRNVCLTTIEVNP